MSVEEVGPTKVYDDLSAFVLEGDRLSTGSLDMLHALDLKQFLEDDPRSALELLHAEASVDPGRPKLFALAELAFLIAKDEEDRDAYMASAVYAYLYLFGEDGSPPPSPYDRRFRQACDLYNGALQRALTGEDGRTLELVGGDRELPVGNIGLSIDRTHFPHSAAEYPTLVPADLFRIKGLTLRLRDAGLGVALIAVPDASQAQVTVDEPVLPVIDKVSGREPAKARRGVNKLPATLFLRVHGGLAQAEAGLVGELELHVTLDSHSVTVNNDEVPLESDISTALAYSLDRSPLWKFSLSGLFEGEAAVKKNRLLFMRTPERGRVPVVFVHGTASNPAYWAPMLNVLMNDPVLRSKTQCWFFQYASGNPLLYSGTTLRDQLKAIIDELDPDGTDPELKRMVLVAHSQGGLVSKLMVVDGSLSWLEEMLQTPVSELNMDEAQTEMLTNSFEFDPLPFVERVVFISTPHQGSFLAARWYSKMMAKFIALPGAVTKTLGSLFENNTKLPKELRRRIPTSLDNMEPGNPMLGILASAQPASRVKVHSIIPVGDADPFDPESLAGADDGVVKYMSAHIEPVESELIVPGSHSCQDRPPAIQEVRRILRLHLASYTRASAARAELEALVSDPGD